MSDLNNVSLTGRLTRDLRTNDRKTVGNNGLAVNKTRKNEKGEYENSAVFVELTFFGNSVLPDLLTKGKLISIVGKLDTNTWEKDGVSRSQTVVNVSEFNILERTPKKEVQKEEVKEEKKNTNIETTKETVNVPF